MAKPRYEGPDFKAIFRQMRADFYAREKEPARQEANARVHELGVRVGAHNQKEKK